MCLAAGIITRDQDIICPVDESGRFLPPVSDFQGQYVKVNIFIDLLMYKSFEIITIILIGC